MTVRPPSLSDRERCNLNISGRGQVQYIPLSYFVYTDHILRSSIWHLREGFLRQGEVLAKMDSYCSDTPRYSTIDRLWGKARYCTLASYTWPCLSTYFPHDPARGTSGGTCRGLQRRIAVRSRSVLPRALRYAGSEACPRVAEKVQVRTPFTRLVGARGHRLVLIYSPQRGSSSFHPIAKDITTSHMHISPFFAWAAPSATPSERARGAELLPL